MYKRQVFVCIAQLFYGQERYTIRGEFPDHSLDNEYVLLYDRSALQGESERLKEAFIDSILVVDKVFHYEGTIDRKPFLASISVSYTHLVGRWFALLPCIVGCLSVSDVFPRNVC